MRPSDNAIFTVRILWRDASIKGTPDAWIRCANSFGDISFYVHGTGNRADYEYLSDMHQEALDMMEAK